MHIAVAGAGPAGLASALHFKRAGHHVAVFERFAVPKPVGSGLILQPTGLTVLADLGLLENIVALGSRIERLYGADAASGRTVLDVRYDAQTGGRFGIAVHRAALFGVLFDAARRAGISVQTDVELQEIDNSGERAFLIDTKGTRIGGFDLVVDATGSRSRLRGFADASCEPRPLPYGAFWASLDWRDGFEPHALTQRYDKSSVMVGVLPIGRPDSGGGDMAAFFWSLKPADLNAVKAAGIEAWKERVISIWPEAAAFTSQINDFEQLSLARYGHHTLRRPAGRRLAVIGDAAHSTSPQLGQGANMALLDAAALAHAVTTNASVADALEAYCLARRRHVRVFQALSWMFTPFYQSDSRVLPFIRDRLVATIARIPPAPQLLAAMVAGTVVDPFARAGLKERDWTSIVQEPSADRSR